MLRHLPNLITFLRIVLVVPVAWLIREQRYEPALILGAIAGASDALDGYLAKRFGWQSWLGGILDPIADKLLLIACFVSLGLVDQHPLWVTGLVVGRDAVIVIGAVAYHYLIGPISGQPTYLSKFTTCIQITYVLVQLLRLTHCIGVSETCVSALLWLVVVSTVLSGIDYVARWSIKARQQLRANRNNNKQGNA